MPWYKKLFINPWRNLRVINSSKVIVEDGWGRVWCYKEARGDSFFVSTDHPYRISDYETYTKLISACFAYRIENNK